MHVVVKPFPFAANGIKIEQLTVGQKLDFGSLAQGLVDGGFIAPEGTKLPGGSVPKSPPPPPAGDSPLVLPEGWRDLHHNILIPLAQKIDASVDKKAAAIAVLEKFEQDEAARKAAATDPATADPDAPQS